MTISSNGPQTESVQGMSQNRVAAASPQGTVSDSALTLDLDKNTDGRVLSAEAINAIQAWDNANKAVTARELGVFSNGQGGQNGTNPESYLNTAQGSSQEPGLDGSGAQLDRNYGLLWYEDRKLSEGPWFPGIAQIREAERAAGDKLEFRSNTRNTAQR